MRLLLGHPVCVWLCTQNWTCKASASIESVCSYASKFFFISYCWKEYYYINQQYCSLCNTSNRQLKFFVFYKQLTYLSSRTVRTIISVSYIYFRNCRARSSKYHKHIHIYYIYIYLYIIYKQKFNIHIFLELHYFCLVMKSLSSTVFVFLY